MLSRLLLLLLLLTLLAVSARAQDLLTKHTGDEIAVKVVEIMPLQPRYIGPDHSDTLLLMATVSLVRYANNTRELRHPLNDNTITETVDLLAGLSMKQRMDQGRQDATSHYDYTHQGPFVGALVATIYGGPVLGLVGPAIIAPHPIAPAHLSAPRPALLADPAYGPAYRQEAQRLKRRRAWNGYKVGVGFWAMFVVAFVIDGL